MRVEDVLDRPEGGHPERTDLVGVARRWSVPTPWWWVIVAPTVAIASLAAAFAARHCRAGSPRLAAITVK